MKSRAALPIDYAPPHAVFSFSFEEKRHGGLSSHRDYNGCRSGVSLAQAAEITRLGKDEILWAIQEEGRCDTEAYIVVDVADVTEVMAALS